jgi:small-conductance mechanosensitive channel
VLNPPPFFYTSIDEEMEVIQVEWLQRWLIRAGVFVAALLLIKFALDFGAEMALWLAAGFWLLVGAAIAIASINAFTSRQDDAPRRGGKARALLLAALPLGFLASSLDCMGLSLAGCSQVCTAIKLVVIPVIALASAAYFRTAAAWLLFGIALLSFVTLIPHCVCYNPGNGWWIEKLGASPVCYVWGFMVSMITLSALGNKGWLWPSVAVCYGIIIGAMSFFLAHHYLHFPW